MNILSEEDKNEYGVRLIGGLIGLSLCFNFVQLEYGLFMNLFGILIAFVFWGIGVNIIAYLASNLLNELLTEISKEKIYRALIFGHLPMILAIISANGIELIEERKIFLISIEVLSIIFSILFLYRVARRGNNVPTTNAKNP